MAGQWFWVVFCWALLAIGELALASFAGWGAGYAHPVFGWAVFFGVALTLVGMTVKATWTEVPEKEVWVIQWVGRYLTSWKSGLHFQFPLLGFMKVDAQVYMGDQMMPLCMDEKVPEGYGGGKVDFTDGSARVDATVYFRIVCPEKAVYGVNDVFAAIAEKLDGAVRTCLGALTLDEANRLKAQYNLARILNGVSHGNAPPEATQSLLYREAYDRWGVEILSVAISDIELSEAQIAAREKVLVAEKEAQAAEHMKQVEIRRAEAKAQSIRLEGDARKEAYEAQFGVLIARGLTAREAADLLNEQLKWEKGIGTNAVIIESGGGSMSGIGAQFAAGMSAHNNRGGNRPS